MKAGRGGASGSRPGGEPGEVPDVSPDLQPLPFGATGGPGAEGGTNLGLAGGSLQISAGVRVHLGSDAFLSARGGDGGRAREPGEGGGGGGSGGAVLIEAPEVVIEGVLDLAFREPDGWVIADYKTDVGTDPDFATRSEAYRRQVELYARAWTRLTGEAVKERVLFYTAQGRIESW